MDTKDNKEVSRRAFVQRAAGVALGGAAAVMGTSCGRAGEEASPKLDRQSVGGEPDVRESVISTARFTDNQRRGTGLRAPREERLTASLQIELVPGGRRIDPRQVFGAENLPPVRDQARRNTCVAFAFTTLNEQARRRRGENVDLSQQHLYFEIEAREPQPELCDDGALMETGAAILAEVGQCSAALVRYRTESCDNDLGAVTPTQARTEAARFRLRTTEINPQDIDGIAKVLQRGWPVAVALRVHPGWNSDETWTSGHVTLPTGDTTGGHAVCLVAYTENPVQPFPRGIFAFKNSWGPGFGASTRLSTRSFAGQGCGTLPWEYVGRYCTGAYVPSEALS